jgi:glycosyltransferase involved in cell wall biosynthesis
MKVSAVIPTYNRRAQVLRAIESVLAQSVPVDEIIVVDDGSTDGTAEAIRRRFGARVSVFQQKNAGVSAARNRGVREAGGEWIAFLDSDDVWMPTKIERQLEALAAFGGEFGLCFTDMVYDGNPDLKLTIFQETGFEPAVRVGALEDHAKYMLVERERPFLFTSTFMVRHVLLKELGGYDEALILGEDLDVTFQLGFRTRFCFVAEPLVRFDRTPSRTDGLCDLYASRDDRKYENLERRYTKWLRMPEVAGTAHEQPVRNLLRKICYDSAACKIHQLRIGPALGEVARLRALGDSYSLIIATLLSHKIAKLRRRLSGLERTDERKPVGPGPNLA